MQNAGVVAALSVPTMCDSQQATATLSTTLTTPVAVPTLLGAPLAGVCFPLASH